MLQKLVSLITHNRQILLLLATSGSRSVGQDQFKRNVFQLSFFIYWHHTTLVKLLLGSYIKHLRVTMDKYERNRGKLPCGIQTCDCCAENNEFFTVELCYLSGSEFGQLEKKILLLKKRPQLRRNQKTLPRIFFLREDRCPGNRNWNRCRYRSVLASVFDAAGRHWYHRDSRRQISVGRHRRTTFYLLERFLVLGWNTIKFSMTLWSSNLKDNLENRYSSWLAIRISYLTHAKYKW